MTEPDIAVRLRVSDARPVLIGDDPTEAVDPRSLAIGVDLADDLHEWARVAAAVADGDVPVSEAAAGVVSSRGRQLASRVAAALGMPVGYVDPLTGDLVPIEVPWPPPPTQPRHRGEPTPWSTGLVVTAFSALVVLTAVLAFSFALEQVNGWLTVVANAVIAAGLAPTFWMGRRIPVWRWVAYGLPVGIGLSWIALLASI